MPRQKESQSQMTACRWNAPRRLIAAGWALVAGVLGWERLAAAQTSVDDFRKSLSQNMNEKADPTLVFALAIGLIGLFLLVMFLKTRTKRLATAGAMNHAGKLLKSVSKELKLKTNEVKQLRLLSEGQGVDNPLVLLLCPSLLAKALKANSQKVDRGVIGALAKRVLSERSSRAAESSGDTTVSAA